MSEEHTKNPIVQAFLEDEDFMDALHEAIGQDIMSPDDVSQAISDSYDETEFSDAVVATIADSDQIRDVVEAWAEEMVDKAICESTNIIDLDKRIEELEAQVKQQEELLKKLVTMIGIPG